MRQGSDPCERDEAKFFREWSKSSGKRVRCYPRATYLEPEINCPISGIGIRLCGFVNQIHHYLCLWARTWRDESVDTLEEIADQPLDEAREMAVGSLQARLCRPVLALKSVVLLLAERLVDGAGSNLSVFVSTNGTWTQTWEIWFSRRPSCG